MSIQPKQPHTDVPEHPHLKEAADRRAASFQNRIADGITRFAGSMWFIYISAVWFVVWIGFGLEKYPFGLLTMIVSLEAIFLSTFVMISQNRADEKRQIFSDHQYALVREEKAQNEELLKLSQQILELTQAIHQLTTAQKTGGEPAE